MELGNQKEKVSLLADTRGQMTVELVVALPVMITIAVIAVNALLLFSYCASFDRIAREAVRIVATSPTFDQGVDQSVVQIESIIGEAFSDKENSSFTVTAFDDQGGLARFTVELLYRPTLFGLGLRDSVFGVPLPVLNHNVSVVVDPYKPGVLI